MVISLRPTMETKSRECVSGAEALTWVLMIVLVVLLALILCQRAGDASAARLATAVVGGRGLARPRHRDPPSSRMGGAESDEKSPPTVNDAPQHEHEIMQAVHQWYIDQGEAASPSARGLSNQGEAASPPASGVQGGASSQPKHASAPMLKWTEYKSWKELAGTSAYRQYWQDRITVLKNYPTDWSKVRKQLASILKEPREWAGSINLTGADGTPSVVAKVPSPFKIGESVQGKTSATIPPEVVAKVTDVPAMFFFHTHPESTSPLISSIDASAAVLGCYHGHHAAHVVVSTGAVIMYGLLPATLARIWTDSHPHAAATRKSYDVYSAIEGLRSYGTYYSAQDLANIMANMGMLYVVYPLDPFVRVAHNNAFVPSQVVNVDEVRRQLVRIEDAQAAAGMNTSRKEDLPAIADADIPGGEDLE